MCTQSSGPVEDLETADDSPGTSSQSEPEAIPVDVAEAPDHSPRAPEVEEAAAGGETESPVEDLETADDSPDTSSQSEPEAIPVTEAPDHSPRAPEVEEAAAGGETESPVSVTGAPAETSVPAPASRTRPRDLEFEEDKVYWLDKLLESLDVLALDFPRGDFSVNYLDATNGRYYASRGGEVSYGQSDEYHFSWYADEEMKRLRRACGVSVSDIRESFLTLDSRCESRYWQWVTKDSRFLFKTVSAEEMKVFRENLKDYCDCICDSAGGSLLAKIYLAGNFAYDSYLPYYFFIMQNTLPAREVSAAIPLAPLDFIWFHGNLARDTLFLENHRLLDYTLYHYDDKRSKGLFLGDFLETKTAKECLRLVRKRKSWKSVSRLMSCFWPSRRRKRARVEADAAVVDGKYQPPGRS